METLSCRFFFDSSSSNSIRLLRLVPVRLWHQRGPVPAMIRACSLTVVSFCQAILCPPLLHWITERFPVVRRRNGMVSCFRFRHGSIDSIVRVSRRLLHLLQDCIPGLSFNLGVHVHGHFSFVPYRLSCQGFQVFFWYCRAVIQCRSVIHLW